MENALRSSVVRREPSERSRAALLGRGLMKYVYLLRSLSQPERTYVGITRDLAKRLAEHNAGRSPHTRDSTPWQIQVTMQFTDDAKADAFERYLKSGSGHAFAKRHLW